MLFLFYQFSYFCCQRHIEDIFVSSKSNMASMVMLHNHKIIFPLLLVHSYLIEAKQSTEKDPFLVNGVLVLIGFCYLIPFFYLIFLLISRLCCQQSWEVLASKQNHHLITMKKPGMISKAISVDLDNLNAMNSTMKKISNLTY